MFTKLEVQSEFNIPPSHTSNFCGPWICLDPRQNCFLVSLNFSPLFGPNSESVEMWQPNCEVAAEVLTATPASYFLLSFPNLCASSQTQGLLPPDPAAPSWVPKHIRIEKRRPQPRSGFSKFTRCTGTLSPKWTSTDSNMAVSNQPTPADQGQRLNLHFKPLPFNSPTKHTKPKRKPNPNERTKLIQLRLSTLSP